MQLLTLLSLGLSATSILAAPTASNATAADIAHLAKRQSCGSVNLGTETCFSRTIYRCLPDGWKQVRSPCT